MVVCKIDKGAIATIEVLLFILFIISALIAGISYPDYMFAPGKRHNAHSGIKDCTSCHIPFTQPRGDTCVASECHDKKFWNKSKGVFKGHLKQKGCRGCHNEHVGTTGQITTIAPHYTVQRENKCTDCHVIGTNHAYTMNLDCADCHYMTEWKNASVNMVHDVASSGCDDCHALSKLHFKTRVRCHNCHSYTKWGNPTFRHKRRVKKGTPCVSCHKLTQAHYKTEQDCGVCHNTAHWKKIKEKHYFAVQHGSKDFNNKCEYCHPITIDKYDCYSGCHKHDKKDILDVHIKLNIKEFLTSCDDCHAAGMEHEAKTGIKAREQKIRDFLIKLRQ